MGFDDLPKDLKNIVSQFAYQCSWETMEKDMQTCKEIKEMEISDVFTRRMMWSHRFNRYMPNPLLEFQPICNFTGAWGDYFDWHSVQSFLWRLDFRKRFVRMLVKTREDWRLSFKRNWRNIQLFDDFFHFLLYTRVSCFKPLWEKVGFQDIQSVRSPYISANWWLQDGF